MRGMFLRKATRATQSLSGFKKTNKLSIDIKNKLAIIKEITMQQVAVGH